MIDFLTHPLINNWPMAIFLNLLVVGFSLGLYWLGATGKFENLFNKKSKSKINSGAKFGQ